MLPFHKCRRLGGQGCIYEIKGSVTRLPAWRGRPNLARLAKLARLARFAARRARQVGQVSEIRVKDFLS